MAAKQLKIGDKVVNRLPRRGILGHAAFIDKKTCRTYGDLFEASPFSGG
jgi:hypothetical protein